MAYGSASRTVSLPPAAIGFAIAIFFVGGLGPNSLLAILAIAVLLVGTYLLWRPREAPILLFMFGYQWLQASTKIFHANWVGADIAALPVYGNDLQAHGDVQLATILSLLGITVLAVGLRLGAAPWRQQDGMLARLTVSQFGPRYWFHLYAAAFVFALLAFAAARWVPGLSQPLLALASLKWAFFWMLAYATFVEPGANKFYCVLALVVELLMGLGGYFADFKTPLIFMLLTATAARVRLSPGQYLTLFGIGALALALGVVWTAVKTDYRRFVSGGETAQIVTVGYYERLTTLISMVKELDGDALATAAHALPERVAYVDLFAVVLDTVPKVLPHEDGALWEDAIARPFMPRIFFPEKSAIDDSTRTNYYTGLNVATAEEGTSISLGYMAESYIDFGAFGMMAPIFGLGWLLGRFYRLMLDRDPSRLLGMALATATLYVACFLETSITKLFGGLVVAMLVSWLLLRFAPRYLPWAGGKLLR